VEPGRRGRLAQDDIDEGASRSANETMKSKSVAVVRDLGGRSQLDLLLLGLLRQRY
jgi:hypothetical protein